ncbi:Gfo/Idh/MocA family protein [Streptomyces sp. NRRL S-920]|uniref:Gfo/Idh/MocA family protein n=1 Tax=Streptomyces sp. NRRL S-920 TaxID=1463921 RepID=UPI0004CA6879|nr:Gfo/Idh/MocA family oxidoreductase [Streptomyces sp. NRRL S-920]
MTVRHPARSLVPVLVGYGRAGRDLHHHSLRTLAEKGALTTGQVLVVDPAHRDDLPHDAQWAPDLAAAVAALPEPDRGVFHLTTPAGQRLPALRQLLAAGARRFIVEKPLAPGANEARQMLALADSAGAQLIPMSVWPSSAVTQELVALLRAGRVGQPRSLRIEQHKPRFRRGLDDAAHSSALQVEMPHQVLLALHLFGTPCRLTAGDTWPLPLPDVLVPALGGARVDLVHGGPEDAEVTSTLVSDLTSPVRMRRLRLTGTEGEIVAHYPTGGDDPYGQLQIVGEESRRIIPDAPLTRLIEDAYRFHLGEGPRPPGTDPALHLAAMDLLDAANTAAHTRGAASKTPVPHRSREAESC